MLLLAFHRNIPCDRYYIALMLHSTSRPASHPPSLSARVCLLWSGARSAARWRRESCRSWFP